MPRDAPDVPHGDAGTPPTASGDGDGPPDDVDRAIVEEWTDETTPFERVYQVLKRTHDPRSASEFADRARVSPTTARKHLRTLADAGQVATTRDGRTTLYCRSETAVVVEHARALLAEHTTAELAKAVADMKASIATWREEHGVESPAELARELDAVDPDEEGGALVREWETTRRNLALAEVALAVEEASRGGWLFGPDGDPSQIV